MMLMMVDLFNNQFLSAQQGTIQILLYAANTHRACVCPMYDTRSESEMASNQKQTNYITLRSHCRVIISHRRRNCIIPFRIKINRERIALGVALTLINLTGDIFFLFTQQFFFSSYG